MNTKNTFKSNIGFENTGKWNVGERNAGDYNVGYGNYGEQNVGFRNFGNRNSGDYNFGDNNAGDCNIGSCNSGIGNVGNHCSGYFCTKDFSTGCFDEPYNPDDLDLDMICELIIKMIESETPFDYSEFLKIPNATIKKIKALHKRFIVAWRERKIKQEE